MITHDTVWSSIVKENSRYEEISGTLKTKDGTTVLALSNDAIGEEASSLTASALTTQILSLAQYMQERWLSRLRRLRGLRIHRTLTL